MRHVSPPGSQCPAPRDGHADLGLWPHAHAKGAKGCAALLRLCSGILLPDPTSKAQCRAGLKSGTDHTIASALKRSTATRRPQVRHQQADPGAPLLRTGGARGPGEAPSDYADSGDGTSQSTLVDSMFLDATDAPHHHPSPQGVTQRTFSIPSSRGPRCSTGPDEPAARRARVLAGPAPRPSSAKAPAGPRHFTLRPNPQYSSVLDVTRGQTTQVAYRRIVHDGKLRCASFHRVASHARAELGCSHAVHDFIRLGTGPPQADADSDELHLPVANTVSFCGGALPPMSHCGASAAERTVAPSFSSRPPAVSFAHPSLSTLSASTSDQERGPWLQQAPGHHPDAYERHRLWEISSPQPGVFPLHCRDTRGVLDPVPLTPMVLDRHQFCYRFYLSGTKMRWQAKVQGRATVELLCYARSTVVALMLLGGYNSGSMVAAAQAGGLARPGRRGRPHCPEPEPERATSERNSPCIIVLPAAFTKLPDTDATIVESFVLFTGIVVFECLLHSS